MPGSLTMKKDDRTRERTPTEDPSPFPTVGIKPERCRQYADELATKGAGTGQTYALAMNLAADTIESLQAKLRRAHAAVLVKDHENPIIQGLTEEVERLREALEAIVSRVEGSAIVNASTSALARIAREALRE